jgi:ankyrin repeat protein
MTGLAELYTLVEKNNHAALEVALKNDPSKVNDYYRGSLLHTATFLHNTECVKVLLKYGAKIDDIVRDDRWEHGCYNYSAENIAQEKEFDDILQLFAATTRR